MKTTQECWQALIDGNTLASSTVSVLLNENGMLIYDDGQSAVQNFHFPEHWSIYTPTEWFNNIPEHGVLCWWGDDRSTAVNITSINGDGWLIDKIGETYIDVIPLTKQEIQQFLDNAPEGEQNESNQV